MPEMKILVKAFPSHLIGFSYKRYPVIDRAVSNYLVYWRFTFSHFFRNTAQACLTWEDVLVENPTDMLALKMAHDSYFYLGYQPQIRDSIARVMPKWKENMPLYGWADKDEIIESEVTLVSSVSVWLKYEFIVCSFYFFNYHCNVIIFIQKRNDFMHKTRDCVSLEYMYISVSFFSSLFISSNTITV